LFALIYFNGVDFNEILCIKAKFCRRNWNRDSTNSSFFKWTLSRDFRPSVFFYQSNAPRPLINLLKPFRIRLRILWLFCGVSDPTEMISAVSLTPGRFIWPRGDFKPTLRDPIFYTFAISLLLFLKNWMFIRPYFLSPRCHWISRQLISNIRNGFNSLVNS
jgi:hypothetical protein